SLIKELILLEIRRHPEDDGTHALRAPEAVARAGVDVDDRSRLHVDHVVVQLPLATTLQNIVHLPASAMIVLDGVLDEGGVQVAHTAVGRGEGPGRSAADAGNRRRVGQTANEVTLARGRMHGEASARSRKRSDPPKVARTRSVRATLGGVPRTRSV